MHSLTKLLLLACYLVTFGNYVSGQTSVVSLYLPSISDASDFGDGDFVFGSLVGAQDGTSTYVLAVVSTGAQDGPTPILGLIEASTTAHLFVAEESDSEGDSSVTDIQCIINEGLSTCEEVDEMVENGVTVSAMTSTFTESVSPIPVTLVNDLPSMTSNQAPPTPEPLSPSSGSSSASAAPASKVTSGSTPAKPSTTTKPNSATHHTASVLLCAFPLMAVVSMLL